ncbi:MAG: ATP-grasp domain-containing protein [Oscillospiraceae bacterium]|nr:ATP-grasp domain-containing protein [Oscillospiraceae bacterium]
MEKNLAIIGASYLQLPLILRAKEMGYRTHVFAWAAGDVGETAADVFHPISIIEKDRILEACREIGICGICSIASDLAVIAVNYVAAALGLPGNSLESTLRCTNKHAMRRAFEAGGDPSPRSLQVDGETDLSALELSWPVIVKPTDRSGSRGIRKVERREDLAEAVRAALDQSLEKKALVEEFAEGKEFSVEYISFRGEHHFLAMTLKYTTGAPHFIETGHLEPAPVDEATLARVRAVVEHALDTLEIRNGASHSEIRIDDAGRIRLIEIGGRMGGDLIGSDLVRCSTGVDFVRAVLQVALGGEPDLTPVCAPRRTEVRFILTEEDLQAYEALQESHPERILRAEAVEPEKIGRAADSSGRAGCYLVDLGPLA